MEKITKNPSLFYKILSVFIAVVLWAIVAYQENTEMTRWINNVPIVVTGSDVLDQNGYCVTDVSRTTLDVKIKGERLPLAKITSKDISVKLDVSGISSSGVSTLSCDINVDKKNIDVSDSRKNSIEVSVEKIITDICPVSVNIVGVPSKGYDLVESSVSPTEVTVRGSQSALASVSSVSTKSVSVSGISSSNSVTAGLTAFDADGKAITGVTFEPSSVEVSYTILKEKTVPLAVVQDELLLGKKITYEPQTVVIYGEPDVLAGITEIKTLPVDISSVSDKEVVKASLDLPQGITSGDGTVDITFTIENETPGSALSEASP